MYKNIFQTWVLRFSLQILQNFAVPTSEYNALPKIYQLNVAGGIKKNIKNMIIKKYVKIIKKKIIINCQKNLKTIVLAKL